MQVELSMKGTPSSISGSPWKMSLVGLALHLVSDPQVLSFLPCLLCPLLLGTYLSALTATFLLSPTGMSVVQSPTPLPQALLLAPGATMYQL